MGYGSESRWSLAQRECNKREQDVEEEEEQDAK